MITVIVTAYNRKEFLHEAMNSLVNQTLDKQYFEVVLLTNFEYDTSSYDSINIRHFILEGSVGEYMYKAIEVAKGEILCFLDDDDLYDRNKLLIILNNFSETTVYFKHNIQPFHSITELNEGASIYRNKLRNIHSKNIKHPNLFAYNRTSIALRKSFISVYLEQLRGLDVSEDWFFFLSFTSSNEKGVYDSDKLSFYRKHDNVSRSALRKSDKNYESYINYIFRLMDSFNYMKGIFKHPKAQKVLNFQLSVFKIRLALLCEERNSLLKNKDLKNLWEASLTNYNEFWLIKALFVRGFILFYFPALSTLSEHLYEKMSKVINSLDS